MLQAMRVFRCYIVLIVLLLSAGLASAHEPELKTEQTDIEVHFRLDSDELDGGYMGNGASLRRFASVVDSIGIDRIDSVVIVSQSSPEGVYEHNVKLSRRRARTLRRYLDEHYPSLSARTYVHADGESWSRLRHYVLSDRRMKDATIRKVLSVIDSDVNVGTKKWRMQQLPVYRYLLTTYYPRIRNSVFFIVYYSDMRREIRTARVGASLPPLTVTPPVMQMRRMPSLSKPEPAPWARNLHLKTNAICWGMGVANVAAEIDLTRHWSFSLPVMYSAWNYFKSTIKFRVFGSMPELRYWVSERNDGVYVGAHFGFAYYNVAFDGAYRYQDHNRETPALGGGLSVGYRLPLDRARRWRVEFSLGCGVYSLHYDKFRNTADVRDGLLVGSERKTAVGIDQAAVTFSYTFDLSGKGGRR